MELSELERVTILMMGSYGGRIRSYDEVKILFNYTFPNRNPILKSGAEQTIRRFQETDSGKD